MLSAIDEVITSSGINVIRATESEDAIVAIVPGQNVTEVNGVKQIWILAAFAGTVKYVVARSAG